MGSNPMMSWRINGVDPEAVTGALLRGTVWRPSVSTRRPVVEIPGVHGTIDIGQLPVFAEPTVLWRLYHQGATPEDHEQLVGSVLAMVSAPKLVLSRVVAGKVTEAAAKLITADWGDGLNPTAELKVAFAIPGVFFRDGNTTPWTALVGSGLTATIPHLSDSTGPIPDAIVRFTGPITNPSITDTNSGTSLSWTGTVAAGEYLFLDASRLTARKAGADAWTAGGTLVGSVDYGGDGPLQLWPAVVTVGSSSLARQVSVSVAGSGMTAATQVAVRAEGSYL